MPIVSWELWLGEIRIATIISDGGCFIMETACEGAPGVDLMLRNRYPTAKECIISTSRLLPRDARQYSAVLRIENRKVVNRERWTEWLKSNGETD